MHICLAIQRPNFQPVKHICLSNYQLYQQCLTLLWWHVGHGSNMGLYRAWKSNVVQLIHAKTMRGCNLFAGYFSSTIESRTIGQSFPGLREEQLSKVLVHPQPDNGKNLMEMGLYAIMRLRFILINVCLLNHIWH